MDDELVLDFTASQEKSVSFSDIENKHTPVEAGVKSEEDVEEETEEEEEEEEDEEGEETEEEEEEEEEEEDEETDDEEEEEEEETEEEEEEEEEEEMEEEEEETNFKNQWQQDAFIFSKYLEVLRLNDAFDDEDVECLQKEIEYCKSRMEDKTLSTLQKQLQERKTILQNMSQYVDLHGRHKRLGAYFVNKQRELTETFNQVSEVISQGQQPY